ncbi:MAG: 16S rRNA (cytidine(1402)-2'-O)-methyltransferase [Cyanobacteria bacterium SIG30]|nr:16S rRNA (cytidine(1402)-2'-O)-methyltransferase [Cyanobacteria bacterium SIG30]
MSELFIVSTPIGNLSDITLRAIDVLNSVDVIACEDTRNTSILCDKYDIKTRLISYHKYSENARIELFLNYLSEGKNIALVSDAGTPLISDPGTILVEAVKKEGFRVTPIVGASAVLALLSSSFREDEDFKFIGFLPKGDTKIQEILELNKNENLVFYESPKRILNVLKIIKNINLNANISVGRELTKKFEEINEGSIDEILTYYQNKSDIKGEFVVLVKKDKTEIDKKEILKDILKLKKYNLSNKDISNILSDLKGYNKNFVYDLLIKKPQ